MTEFLSFLAMFLLGMITGAGMFIGCGIYQLKRLNKAKETILQEFHKRNADIDNAALEEKKNSIKQRLIMASDMAKAQIELRSQAEMPSKNALHSRHKNGLVYEINEIEQQKIDILKTILEDGFDPIITTVNDGGFKEEMPLSAYIASAQQNLNGKSVNVPPPPGDAPGEPKKIGKFFLYRGGKDDGTIH